MKEVSRAIEQDSEAKSLFKKLEKLIDRQASIAIGTDDAIEPIKNAFVDLYPNAIQTEGVPTNIYSDKLVFGWSGESGF